MKRLPADLKHQRHQVVLDANLQLVDFIGVLWRRDPESNRAERICNPVHNRFAIAPYLPEGRNCR